MKYIVKNYTTEYFLHFSVYSVMESSWFMTFCPHCVVSGCWLIVASESGTCVLDSDEPITSCLM